MARVQAPTQTITRDGLVAAYTAPTVDGDAVGVGRVMLHVKNANAAACTVTIESPLVVEGLDVEDQVVIVAAGSERFIGPLPERVFARPVGQADAGKAYVNYSIQASVTRAVLGI